MSAVHKNSESDALGELRSVLPAAAPSTDPLPTEASSVESSLDADIRRETALSPFSEPHLERAELGAVEINASIRTSLGPVSTFPDYKIFYPEAVIQALSDIYQEYNAAFRPLAEANKEWASDYQHCQGMNGDPVNYFVQIDMAGLTPEFLRQAPLMEPADLNRELRRRIFEIENSLAVYQILELAFESSPNEPSHFKAEFRRSLDEIRLEHGKPIALLAVTDEKHEAMRQSEFGKQPGEPLTSAEVRELSGFDRLFGPQEFRAYLEANSGQCDYLLYVRSSDPVAKLKRPDTRVSSPLLEDAEMRRVIKANALTYSVDAPEMEPARRINDTKAYLPMMGMGFRLTSPEDMLSPELVAHMAAGRSFSEYAGERLSLSLRNYLESVGVDPRSVESGERLIRAKPLQGTYGCYGHVRLNLTDRKDRMELNKNMRNRGEYVVQPELDVSAVVNVSDGTTYNYIDRNFFALRDGKPVFLGGFRNMMPVESQEAKHGRIHGSRSMVCAEVLPERLIKGEPGISISEPEIH